MFDETRIVLGLGTGHRVLASGDSHGYTQILIRVLTGLGKKLWEGWKGQRQFAPQMFMPTTNGTFGSQTFGISFGTSGRTNDGQVMAACKSDMFIASTFESLSEDMARGQGEHLASLATMMGVPVEHQPAFFSLAQDRYRTLLERGEDSPLAVIKAIQETVVENPLLAGVGERP